MIFETAPKSSPNFWERIILRKFFHLIPQLAESETPFW